MLLEWLNRFRRNKENPPAPSPREEAEEIVVAFSKFIAESRHYIPDESLLPHPKETIRDALQLHIDTMEVVGTTPGNVIRSMKDLQTWLEPFRKIEPEDSELVQQINQHTQQHGMEARTDQERRLFEMGKRILGKYGSRHSS